MNKVNNEQYMDWIFNNYEKLIRAFNSLRETHSITEEEYQEYIKLEANKMFDLIEKV